MSTPSERLRALGITLPEAPAALASYVPAVKVPLEGDRSLLYVAGQVPLESGKPRYTGLVPEQVSVEQAQDAARLCALNILAQAQAACGLDNVRQVAQVTGFVQCGATFTEQPRVINAASDLLLEVLGEAGRHARVAVGSSALPLGVPVEVAAVLVVSTG